MESEKETFNIIIISVQIKQLQEQLELGKRLAEYCECWLCEFGIPGNRETAEADLIYLQEVVKTLVQKIKDLEAEKSQILQNNVTE